VNPDELARRALLDAEEEHRADIGAYRLRLLALAGEAGILSGLMSLKGTPDDEWTQLATLLDDPDACEEIRVTAREMNIRKAREHKRQNDLNLARKREKRRAKKVHDKG